MKYSKHVLHRFIHLRFGEYFDIYSGDGVISSPIGGVCTQRQLYVFESLRVWLAAPPHSEDGTHKHTTHTPRTLSHWRFAIAKSVYECPTSSMPHSLRQGKKTYKSLCANFVFSTFCPFHADLRTNKETAQAKQRQNIIVKRACYMTVTSVYVCRGTLTHTHTLTYSLYRVVSCNTKLAGTVSMLLPLGPNHIYILWTCPTSSIYSE